MGAGSPAVRSGRGADHAPSPEAVPGDDDAAGLLAAAGALAVVALRVVARLRVVVVLRAAGFRVVGFRAVAGFAVEAADLVAGLVAADFVAVGFLADAVGLAALLVDAFVVDDVFLAAGFRVDVFLGVVAAGASAGGLLVVVAFALGRLIGETDAIAEAAPAPTDFTVPVTAPAADPAAS